MQSTEAHRVSSSIVVVPPRVPCRVRHTSSLLFPPHKAASLTLITPHFTVLSVLAELYGSVHSFEKWGGCRRRRGWVHWRESDAESEARSVERARPVHQYTRSTKWYENKDWMINKQKSVQFLYVFYCRFSSRECKNDCIQRWSASGQGTAAVLQQHGGNHLTAAEGSRPCGFHVSGKAIWALFIVK